MKNLDLKIDYKNKTFLYQGYFYGYIENRIVFLFWKDGSDKIPIDRIKSSMFYNTSFIDERAFAKVESNRSFAGIRHIGASSGYNFWPDIFFESDEHVKQFIVFINWCYLN